MKFTIEEIQYLYDMVVWPNKDCSTPALELERAFGKMSKTRFKELTRHREFVNGLLSKLGLNKID